MTFAGSRLEADDVTKLTSLAPVAKLAAVDVVVEAVVVVGILLGVVVA